MTSTDPNGERDPVTGLPGRLAVERVLDRAGDEALTLVALDLDGFRVVNDRLGEEVGDALLWESARRLERVARSHPPSGPGGRARALALGRLGDDEFGLVLAGGPDEIVVVVDRLLGAFRSPMVVDVATVTLTVSIGIAASAAPEGASGHRITQWAARAARRAAARGGDRAVVYSLDMSPSHRAQLAVEQLLLDR